MAGNKLSEDDRAFIRDVVVIPATTAANAATQLAAKADARIQAHEKLCEILQRQLLGSLNGLWWIVLVSAGALICGMGGLIVTLVVHHA